MLTALAASVLVCGVAIPVQAQGTSSKGAAKATPSKPEAAKPEARSAAAVAGTAEPRVATTRIDGRLNLYIVEKLLKLPMDYFERTPTGRTLSDQVEEFELKLFGRTFE